jgi:hypothetical protein
LLQQAAIPPDDLAHHVPLETEILVRDRATYCGDLAQHRRLIGRLDRGEGVGFDLHADDVERRRHADLEARRCRHLATGARVEEILIGRARLARIAEFAEDDVVGLAAFGEAETLEARAARRDRCAVVGLEERIGEQHRILPTDPDAPAARLAIGDVLQAAAERRPGNAENIFRACEADAADEMSQSCHFNPFPRVFLIERGRSVNRQVRMGAEGRNPTEIPY